MVVSDPEALHHEPVHSRPPDKGICCLVPLRVLFPPHRLSLSERYLFLVAEYLRASLAPYISVGAF